jgi:hypothetical protein
MNTSKRKHSSTYPDELSLWLRTVTAIISQYSAEAIDRRWRKACSASVNHYCQTACGRLH